jgi:hypothetical protein
MRADPQVALDSFAVRLTQSVVHAPGQLFVSNVVAVSLPVKIGSQRLNCRASLLLGGKLLTACFAQRNVVHRRQQFRRRRRALIEVLNLPSS